MIIALPLLLLATASPATAELTQAAQKSGARISVSATATILPSAKIRQTPSKEDKARHDRQYSKRGDMPMVEFY